MRTKKVPWDMLALFLFFAVIVFFVVLRIFPGFRAVLFQKSPEIHQETNESRQGQEDHDIHEYIGKSKEPIDFSFLQNAQSKTVPNLKGALEKRHLQAIIKVYNSEHLLFEHQPVMEDFFDNDGKPKPLLIEYVYRYRTSDTGILEQTNGSILYCATIGIDEFDNYHLVLERRIHNIPNCMYNNPQERFYYIFEPDERERGRSKNKIISKIDSSRRNKDLHEMTEEEIQRLKKL